LLGNVHIGDYRMSKHILGGLVLAAFLSPGAAVAAPAAASTPVTPARHARASYFTSNQNRTDVPAHTERMFKTLDTNHDGFVSKEEIASLQTQFEQRSAKSAPKRAAHLFDHLDTNHDGKITQEEVDASRAKRRAATGKAKTRIPAGASLFDRADANKDGVITRAEFDAATTAGKITLRHPGMRGQIARLFDVADANKDGRLSLDEARQAALKEFDAADLDHDGALTPAERRQAAQSARAKRPPA
jgi:Ca2+-binding EF-hand superfamily protein